MSRLRVIPRSVDDDLELRKLIELAKLGLRGDLDDDAHVARKVCSRVLELSRRNRLRIRPKGSR